MCKNVKSRDSYEVEYMIVNLYLLFRRWQWERKSYLVWWSWIYHFWHTGACQSESLGTSHTVGCRPSVDILSVSLLYWRSLYFPGGRGNSGELQQWCLRWTCWAGCPVCCSECGSAPLSQNTSWWLERVLLVFQAGGQMVLVLKQEGTVQVCLLFVERLEVYMCV